LRGARWSLLLLLLLLLLPPRLMDSPPPSRLRVHLMRLSPFGN
jgi:hypothetical protein